MVEFLSKTDHLIFPPLIVITTIIASIIFRKLFTKFIERSADHMQNDPTNYKFLLHAITALIYVFGLSFAIYSIPYLRTFAQSLLAGAGILAVAIGFASQQALSNIISGIFIIMFKPFRVNDRLKVRENITGIVEDITLRHTVIRDFENKRILIPNTVISNEIIVNSDFTDDKICKWIEIPIGYNADIKKAKTIMRDEVFNHPNFMDNRTEEQIQKGDYAVPVRVIMLNDSSITLRAWAWAKDAPDAFIMSCDLLESIKIRFDNEGIEIPYPYFNHIVHKK